MAVANTKSNAIEKADATQPPQIVPGYLAGSGIKLSIGTVEVAAADSDGSVYRMCRLPAGAVILRLEIMNDAITAGTDYDIGLYATNKNGGAVADANLFGTAIDMSSARTLPFDAMFEASDIADVEKRIWERLGLSADNFLEYDVCFTANTVGSAAGTLSMRILWTV